MKFKIIEFDTLNSTNVYLKENLKILKNGVVAVAKSQTEGRGRRGHTWANDNSMLFMSVLLKNVSNTANISLMAAVAVCEAIDELFSEKFADRFCPAKIKWPNDIIVSEKYKVCGILCESVISNYNLEDFGSDIICGIGINVNTNRDFFDKNNLFYAASLLSISGMEFLVDKVRDTVLEKFSRRVEKISPETLSESLDEYKKRCVTLGKEILINSETDINFKDKNIAFARNIDENGALICQNKEKIFKINSGEVSVRGLYGYV